MLYSDQKTYLYFFFFFFFKQKTAYEMSLRDWSSDVCSSDLQVDLFAEGPTPEWALPVPTAVEGAPAGRQRFAFDLDGAPPGATYDGARIALTAVAGDSAIEVTARLD